MPPLITTYLKPYQVWNIKITKSPQRARDIHTLLRIWQWNCQDLGLLRPGFEHAMRLFNQLYHHRSNIRLANIGLRNVTEKVKLLEQDIHVINGTVLILLLSQYLLNLKYKVGTFSTITERWYYSTTGIIKSLHYVYTKHQF